MQTVIKSYIVPTLLAYAYAYAAAAAAADLADLKCTCKYELVSVKICYKWTICQLIHSIILKIYICFSVSIHEN